MQHWRYCVTSAVVNSGILESTARIWITVSRRLHGKDRGCSSGRGPPANAQEQTANKGLPACPVREAWGHADSRCQRCLRACQRLGIFAVRSSIPDGRCSQGGAKIPTGGKGDVAQARERLPPPLGRRVSRFGVIPRPTVIVRMKENGCGGPRFCAWVNRRSVCPDSGPERGKP